MRGARAASNTLVEQYNEAVLNAAPDVAQAGSRLDTLDTRTRGQDIALTKALGGGYRADPPAELKPL